MSAFRCSLETVVTQYNSRLFMRTKYFSKSSSLILIGFVGNAIGNQQALTRTVCKLFWNISGKTHWSMIPPGGTLFNQIFSEQYFSSPQFIQQFPLCLVDSSNVMTRCSHRNEELPSYWHGQYAPQVFHIQDSRILEMIFLYFI